MRSAFLIFFVPLLILSLAPATGGTQTGQRYTQLDYPRATITTAGGINDKGEIVGNWSDKHGRGGIFVLTNGVYHTVAAPKWMGDVGAAGINNAGDIVGSCSGKDGIARGFICKHGVFHKFDIPNRDPHDLLQPEAINDKDEVVGSYLGSDDNAFLYRNGIFTALSPPHAIGAAAHGINDQGDVVGQYSDGQGHEHGFLLKNGQYTSVDLGDPASSTTIPWKITNKGVIIGEFSSHEEHFAHDYISASGSYSIIDSSRITEVDGINDKGEVVGMYEDNNSKYHGFVMTVPIPHGAGSAK